MSSPTSDRNFLISYVLDYRKKKIFAPRVAVLVSFLCLSTILQTVAGMCVYKVNQTVV